LGSTRRRSRRPRPCGAIVRRDSGQSYEEFLTMLAKASGIGTPTRADLARIDRNPKAAERLEEVDDVTDDVVTVIEEIVADKGYRSRTTVHDI
jgi:hypothetical protein